MRLKSSVDLVGGMGFHSVLEEHLRANLIGLNMAPDPTPDGRGLASVMTESLIHVLPS